MALVNRGIVCDAVWEPSMRDASMYRLLFFCFPVSLLALPGSRACAPVAAKGQHVHIADESAIIVWDAATKTQHFICRATFGTRAANLGFLVPTPTKPELASASDAAFTQLARLTQPRVHTIQRYRLQSAPEGRTPFPAASVPPVRVLEERRVAGYRCVILE